eukprot:TRINITY_DN399_c0_g1_i4.p3 TRINITY_DN399_c0_g1~~TRINITY_DN399_c0_g1_i4.p3  ORF type:complete len:201 (-),score=16.98 TRINITY_DN399_c0_g1_i4:270-872(-)
MNFKAYLLLIFTSAIVNTSADVLCKDCEQLVEAIVEFLTNTEVQTSVVQNLDGKVYDRFKSSIQQTCDLYVEVLIPQIFQYIDEEISPAGVCKAAKICKSSLPLDLTFGSLVDCEYCELVVEEVSDALSNTEIQTNIKNILKVDICPALPFSTKECATFVNKYIDDLFIILEGYLKPPSVCGKLGFCGASPYPDMQHLVA